MRDRDKSEILQGADVLNGISMEDLMSVIEAVLEAYPMILLVNLTKNTYTMIKEDGFLADELPRSGVYDNIVDYAAQNVHPNYQKLLLESFSREHLLKIFDQGKKESCAKLYQKGRGKNYQWVSVNVIRVQDKDGDVREVCINKILGSGQGLEFRRFSGEPAFV